MTVRRSDQPEDDLAAEERLPVLVGHIAALQQLHDVDHARPVPVAFDGRLVFASGRHAQRLATVLLRQAQHASVLSELPIEALDDQHAAPAEGPDLGLRDIETELLQKDEAVVLVVDTCAKVDFSACSGDRADLGLEDVGRRRGADRPHPLPVMEQEGHLFLRPSNRDAESLFRVDTKWSAPEISEILLDLRSIKRCALKIVQGTRALPLGQELHRAHAVAADFLEQAVGVRPAAPKRSATFRRMSGLSGSRLSKTATTGSPRHGALWRGRLRETGKRWLQSSRDAW